MPGTSIEVATRFMLEYALPDLKAMLIPPVKVCGTDIKMGLDEKLPLHIECKVIKSGHYGDVITSLYAKEFQGTTSAREWGWSDLIGSFGLSGFSGCCGSSILYNMSVVSHFRGRGVGKLLTQLAVEAITMAGYCGLFASTVPTNRPMDRFLADLDFKKIDSEYQNARTHNMVTTWFKKLDYEAAANSGIIARADGVEGSVGYIPAKYTYKPKYVLKNPAIVVPKAEPKKVALKKDPHTVTFRHYYQANATANRVAFQEAVARTRATAQQNAIQQAPIAHDDIELD